MAQRYNFKKSYTIHFQERAEYCFAKIEGDLSALETARDYWQEIVNEVTRLEPKRLLIWEETSEPLSTQDTFALVSELSLLTQFLTLRIALLDENKPHLDRNKLGEMIATNRGFTCRVFSDMQDAESWLMAKVRPSSQAQNQNKTESPMQKTEGDLAIPGGLS